MPVFLWTAATAAEVVCDAPFIRRQAQQQQQQQHQWSSFV